MGKRKSEVADIREILGFLHFLAPDADLPRGTAGVILD
jgi:hypothetical protein